jgi:hypothetical protein
MKVTTFKSEKYSDCPIYYRNLKNHFEYLTIIENELYTAHLTVRPHLITRTLYLLGIEKLPYSQTHLNKIISILRNMAETTIDYKLKKESD